MLPGRLGLIGCKSAESLGDRLTRGSQLIADRERIQPARTLSTFSFFNTGTSTDRSADAAAAAAATDCSSNRDRSQWTLYSVQKVAEGSVLGQKALTSHCTVLTTAQKETPKATRRSKIGRIGTVTPFRAHGDWQSTLQFEPGRTATVFSRRRSEGKKPIQRSIEIRSLAVGSLRVATGPSMGGGAAVQLVCVVCIGSRRSRPSALIAIVRRNSGDWPHFKILARSSFSG